MDNNKDFKPLEQITLKQTGETPEEKAKRLGVNLIPKRVDIPADEKPVHPGANPTVAVCGECGIELKKVMMYCCNRQNCPCFVKATL